MARDPSATASSAEPAVVRYSETLRVPLRWWALATSFEVTVFVAFAVALPLLAAVLAVAVLVLVSTAWFVSYGSARLVVTDATFRAGRARIAVSLLADPRALSSAETWQAAGPGADARAYLVLRPYLRESILVQVVDPADPAPYWLVSSRRPEQLAAALDAAVGAAVSAAGGAAGGASMAGDEAGTTDEAGRGVSTHRHGAELAEPGPGAPARLTD